MGQFGNGRQPLNLVDLAPAGKPPVAPGLQQDLPFEPPRRPVIIIPGLMGSWWRDGRWEIDPILNTYDGLIESLEKAGWEKNKDLVEFGYDWRQNNQTTAQLLGRTISETLSRCACPQVDLVAHSMGGLIARAHIQSHEYGGGVANLIMVGTPNNGSIKAYSVWEAGRVMANSWDWQDRLWSWLLEKTIEIESYELGFTDPGQYVRSELPSIGQLLPVNQSYITGRVYPDGYPRNWFLERLNSETSLAGLNQVRHHVLGAIRILTPFRIITESPSKLWPHGRPAETFYGHGDGTVAFLSLIGAGSPYYVVHASHGGIVTQGAGKVIELLGKAQVGPVSGRNSPRRMTMVYVKSPVELSVVDSLGRRTGPDAAGIPGSFYTGSGALAQMITVPEEATQPYRIELTGTGTGRFTLGISQLAQGSEAKTVEVQGLTKTGQKHVYHWRGEDLIAAEPEQIHTDPRGGEHAPGTGGNSSAVSAGSEPSLASIDQANNPRQSGVNPVTAPAKEMPMPAPAVAAAAYDARLPWIAGVGIAASGLAGIWILRRRSQID